MSQRNSRHPGSSSAPDERSTAQAGRTGTTPRARWTGVTTTDVVGGQSDPTAWFWLRQIGPIPFGSRHHILHGPTSVHICNGRDVIEVWMRRRQPFRYGPIAVRALQLGDDRSQAGTDTVLIELKREVHLRKPASSDAQQIWPMAHQARRHMGARSCVGSGQERPLEHMTAHCTTRDCSAAIR